MLFQLINSSSRQSLHGHGSLRGPLWSLYAPLGMYCLHGMVHTALKYLSRPAIFSMLITASREGAIYAIYAKIQRLGKYSDDNPGKLWCVLSSNHTMSCWLLHNQGDSSSGESVPDRLALQYMSHKKFCGFNRQKFLDGCLPLAQNRLPWNSLYISELHLVNKRWMSSVSVAIITMGLQFYQLRPQEDARLSRKSHDPPLLLARQRSETSSGLYSFTIVGEHRQCSVPTIFTIFDGCKHVLKFKDPAGALPQIRGRLDTKIRMIGCYAAMPDFEWKGFLLK